MANMTTQEILQGIKDWAAPKVIYDISAAHNNTKYTDLADALGTNGGNIPQEYRKGGITVRYVQSNDNKYKQARCMAQNFTTDVTQWQGVDEEPTAGSNNLANSDGVAMRFAEFIGSPTEKTVSVHGTTTTPTGINLANGKRYAIYVQCSTAVTHHDTGVWVYNSTNNQYTKIKQLTAAEYAEGVTFEYTPEDNVKLMVRPYDTGTVAVKVWVLTPPITLDELNTRMAIENYLLSEAYGENGAITYDANGAISGYAVKWSDGTAGTYTSTNWDSSNNMYKGYEVTYGSSYKVVQPAVTVVNHKITNVPEKQIVEL